MAAWVKEGYFRKRGSEDDSDLFGTSLAEQEWPSCAPRKALEKADVAMEIPGSVLGMCGRTEYRTKYSARVQQNRPTVNSLSLLCSMSDEEGACAVQ